MQTQPAAKNASLQKDKRRFLFGFRLPFVVGFLGFAGFGSLSFMAIKEESDNQMTKELLLDLVKQSNGDAQSISAGVVPDQENYFEQPSLRNWREVKEVGGHVVYSFEKLAAALGFQTGEPGRNPPASPATNSRSANQLLMELSRGIRLPFAVIHPPSRKTDPVVRFDAAATWHPDIHKMFNALHLHSAVAMDSGDAQKLRAVMLIYLRWNEAVNQAADLDSRLRAQVYNRDFLFLLDGAVGSGLMDVPTLDAISHYLGKCNDLASLEEALRHGALSQIAQIDRLIETRRQLSGLVSIQRLLMEGHTSLMLKPSQSALCDFWRMAIGSPFIGEWRDAGRRVDQHVAAWRKHRHSFQGWRRTYAFEELPPVSSDNFNLAAHNFFLRKAITAATKVEQLILASGYEPNAVMGTVSDAFYNDSLESTLTLKTLGGTFSSSADQRSYSIYMEMPRARRNEETKVGRPWYIRRIFSNRTGQLIPPRRVLRTQTSAAE